MSLDALGRIVIICGSAIWFWVAAGTVIFPIHCVWTDCVGHSFFHLVDTYVWSRPSAAPLMLFH